MSPTACEYQSWIDVLSLHAQSTPDREAFTFLLDGESQQVRWDYRTLDTRARAIGAHLRQACDPGDRAMLLYQPGPEFIAAFFGCLYAGVIAVPGYPPRSAEHERALPRLGGMIADAQPAIVLTASARMLETVEACVGSIPCLDTETLPDALAAEWQKPAGIAPDTIAFLQYTSGSTSSPKGVIVSHGNLLHNSAALRDAVGHTRDSRGVIWLPPYHDMGLIGGILQPIFVGFPVTLMPPAAFLQKPLRLLKAITDFKATTVAGPDFAYDLCARSVKPEDRAGLDLSTLRIAFTGAEPVRESTIDRFTEAFAPHGFRRNAFYPCYGLAEATLIVTGGELLSGASRHPSDTQPRVACGQAVSGTDVRIVNPDTRVACAQEETGEIWVRGPGVAHGYWKRTDQTIETFAARLAPSPGTPGEGRGEGPSPGRAEDPHPNPLPDYREREKIWLRTGDLGFLADGRLCIAGRIKDLIIIRGRNHHPNDIEQTAGSCHAALRTGGGAAFGVDVGGRERLVIVHEIERTQRNTAPDEIFESIRESVSRAHELAPHAIVLLKPGRLPRTSSGKVRRHACRDAFLNNEDLGEVARWIAPEVQDSVSDEQPSDAGRSTGSSPADGIESWLVAKLAATLGLPISEIDPAEPFARYGLDSANAVGLACEIETELKLELEASLLWDYPSVRALAGYLASATETNESSTNRAA